MAAETELIHDRISEEIIDSVRRLAHESSTDKITVRDVLKDMKITNRVFYNRFHNIDEVLEILYQDLIHKIRESMAAPWQQDMDFFDHIRKIAAQTLILSYEYKGKLSQFIFETDSSSDTNFLWWDRQIRNLIAEGKKSGFLREDLNEADLSYSIWCYIRGFNADAMARNLTREEALTRFLYGFGVFLQGMRA